MILQKINKKLKKYYKNYNFILQQKNEKNKENLNSKYYLTYVAIIGFFRTFMYIFFKDHVGKVKVTDIAWNNPITREVIHGLTRLILMLMFFKGCIFAWGANLDRKKDRDNLSIISFLFDVILMISLSKKLFIDKDSEQKAISTKDKAFVHRNPIVPFVIQSSNILAAAIFYFIKI